MLLLQHFTKKCNICKEIKNKTSFCNDIRLKSGLMNRCKECDKIRKKISRVIAPEINAKSCSKWYIINKEKVKNYQINYLKTEKGNASRKNSQYKRRAKVNQGDVTTSQIIELQKNAKVCYWCNKPLKNKVIHIDHYIPLSKGGEHTLKNLVVSCDSCNFKKNAKDPIVFANSIGRLL